jgi:hypothetical protein
MIDRRSFLGDSILGAIVPAFKGLDADALSLRRVCTVQDLRGLSPASGDVAFVAGYYRENDGGGGLFFWSPEAERDVPGLALRPDGRNGAGRWLRWSPSDVLSVRNFGAHPDQNDNADALQAALDVAADLRGTVHVPTGVYRISRPLIMKPYVVVQGDGVPSVIEKTSNAVGPSIQRALPNRDAEDNYAVDCILAVDRPDTGRKFTHGVQIRNLTLRGHAHDTNRVEDRNTYGLYAPRLLRAQIDGVSVTDVRAGFHFDDIIVSQVRDCQSSRTENGFQIPNLETGGGTSLTMTGCYALKSDKWGYYLRGISYSTLVGCACDYANRSGGGGGYFFGACHGVTVSSCGCEVTAAPALRINNSELNVSGFKTYSIRGRGAASAYVEVKNAIVQFAGCRLPALDQPKQTRNGQYEDRADVTYAHGDRPSGGRSAVVDETSSVMSLGNRAAGAAGSGELDLSIRGSGVRFEASDTTFTPDGVQVRGDRVLDQRQPAIGPLNDESGGTASSRVSRVNGADAVETLNDNFASICQQLDRIRAVLGDDGHGLTDD